MSDLMFDPDSFSSHSLKNSSEVKSAVQYLAKNEVGFRNKLASEGVDYDEVQQKVKEVWLALLKVCAKYKYSDYIVSSKRAIYGLK